MKICTICNLHLPIEAFRLHKGKYILSQCKTCLNKQGKEAYKRRRNKLRQSLADFKIKHGCLHCQWNQFPEGLDLHHLDCADKDSSIANLLNRGQHRNTKDR